MHHSEYRPHIIRAVQSAYSVRPGDVFQFVGEVKSFVCKSLRHAGKYHEVITTECGHVFFVGEQDKIRTWTEATHLVEFMSGHRKGEIAYAYEWQIFPDMSNPSGKLFFINSDVESRSILQGAPICIERGADDVEIVKLNNTGYMKHL